MWLPMTPGQRVIDRFGGIAATSRAVGLMPSTVQGWWERGRIPAHRQDAVLEAARAAGIDLTPADFFAVKGKVA